MRRTCRRLFMKQAATLAVSLAALAFVAWAAALSPRSNNLYAAPSPAVAAAAAHG